MKNIFLFMSMFAILFTTSCNNSDGGGGGGDEDSAIVGTWSTSWDCYIYDENDEISDTAIEYLYLTFNSNGTWVSLGQTCSSVGSVVDESTESGDYIYNEDSNSLYWYYSGTGESATISATISGSTLTLYMEGEDGYTMVLTKVSDQGGATGLVKTMTYSDGDANEVFTFTYDSDDSLVEVNQSGTDGSMKWTLEYDGLSLVHTESVEGSDDRVIEATLNSIGALAYTKYVRTDDDETLTESRTYSYSSGYLSSIVEEEDWDYTTASGITDVVDYTKFEFGWSGNNLVSYTRSDYFTGISGYEKTFDYAISYSSSYTNNGNIDITMLLLGLEDNALDWADGLLGYSSQNVPTEFFKTSYSDGVTAHYYEKITLDYVYDNGVLKTIKCFEAEGYNVPTVDTSSDSYATITFTYYE